MNPGRSVRTYFLFGSVGAASILVLYILQPFIKLLVLSIVASVVLYPVVAYGKRRLALSDTLAAMLTLGALVLFLAAVLFLFGNSIWYQGVALYGSYQDGSLAQYVGQVFASIQGALARYVPSLRSISSTDAIAMVQKYAQSALQWVAINSVTTFSSAGGFLFDLFIFFMALFFFLKEGVALKRHVLALSPLTKEENETIATRMTAAIRTIVQGMFFKAILQGIAAAIGCVLFGIPGAFLWAAASAVSSFVPAIGIALTYVPMIIYVFFAKGWLFALGFAAWWVVLAMMLIDNILGPMLTSRGTQLHPLLVLLSALGGFAFFGPSGILLGPLSVSFLLTLLSVSRNEEL